MSIQDPVKPNGENPDTIAVNGSIPNGKIGEESRESTPNSKFSPKMRKAKTMGDLPVVRSQDNIDGSSAGSSIVGDMELSRDSLSPSLLMAIGGTMTPSRKSMEALKKVSSTLFRPLCRCPLTLLANFFFFFTEKEWEESCDEIWLH